MDYINEINKRIQEKNKQGKYSLFSTDVATKALKTNAMDIYFDILEDWDRQCNLPIKLGEALNNAMRSKTNLVAFSRVYIGELNATDNIQSEEIVDIATNGLKNNGHVNSSGVIQNINSPSDCLSPLVGIEGWINLVGSYKSNNAVILYSLPKECIDNDCHFKDNSKVNMIYDFDNNIIRIKPELLIGMTVKNKDVTDVFLTKEDMLEMNNNKTR